MDARQSLLSDAALAEDEEYDVFIRREKPERYWSRE
jgi:hypothetical protein